MNPRKIDNVISLVERQLKESSLDATRDPPQHGGHGGEPPMELTERVGNLETDMRDVRDRLIRVEIKLDSCATRDDMHKEFNLQTWRIIGAVLAAAGILIAGLKLL